MSDLKIDWLIYEPDDRFWKACAELHKTEFRHPEYSGLFNLQVYTKYQQGFPVKMLTLTKKSGFMGLRCSTLVGYLIVAESAACRHVAEITDLCISKPNQRQGYGSKMIKRFATTHSERYERINVAATEDSKEFYLKLGFQPLYTVKDGEMIILTVLTKDLIKE